MPFRRVNVVTMAIMAFRAFMASTAMMAVIAIWAIAAFSVFRVIIQGVPERVHSLALGYSDPLCFCNRILNREQAAALLLRALPR